MNRINNKSNRTKFLVLLALIQNEMHGYEIAKYINHKTKGFFTLPFGSLYPVLHALEKEKLISAKWKNKNSQKPKKIYALTNSGRSFLSEEIHTFNATNAAISTLLPVGG